jgi:hypothetical protein
MDYKKIYNSLITRGKSRKLNCYVEKHHIIPRCLGGSDDDDNLVELTPEEHYLAHQLLVKIYIGNHSLVKAAAMMITNRPSNKMYGWLRRRFSAAKSIEQSGNGNSQYGTKWARHELFGRVKIKSVLLEEYISQGWFIGSFKEVNVNKRCYVDPIKREKDILLYREYYKTYCKYGFEEFVKQTDYKYSKANLVARFSKLLPEFKPQNGKKR